MTTGGFDIEAERRSESLFLILRGVWGFAALYAGLPSGVDVSACI